MFNKNMIDVLSEINNITDTVILKYPQTVAVSESQDVMVLVDLSKFDSDEFPDIGLNNSLSDLLSIIKLFPDEREIELQDNRVIISSGANSSSMITDSIELMDAVNKDPIQFTKTEEAPSVAEFELSVEDIKNIKSATGVFKDLSEVIFTSQDGDMRIWLGATNKFNAKSNTYSVSKAANTTKEFEIKIPVLNFKKLPVSEYKIDIKYNSARDNYRILLTNKTIEGFKILMSVSIN